MFKMSGKSKVEDIFNNNLTESVQNATNKTEMVKNEVGGINNNNVFQPSQKHERMAINSTELSATMSKHKQEMHELEIRNIAQSISLAVPTADMEVKLYLRQFGHPVCLFGEGAYERRERLKTLVARVCAGGDIIDKAGQDEEEEEEEEEEDDFFYVKGSEELKPVRLHLTKLSLRRSYNRMKAKRLLMDNISRVKYDEDRNAYMKHIEKEFSLVLSQVGDERPLTCGKFSPDSKQFATSSWTGFVKIWSVPDCQCIRTLRGHNDRVHTLAWRPLSSALLNSTNDSTYYMNEEIEEKEKLETNENYSENNSAINKTVNLASAGADCNILLWNSMRLSPLGTLKGHEDRINGIQFHPCGNYLGSCSHDETWRFWDLTAEKELFFQEGHCYAIHALKFHPDGSLVFTGDLGGIVRATDVRTGRTVRAFPAHAKQVLNVDVDPQNAYQLATCSDDHFIKIWDLRKCGKGDPTEAVDEKKSTTSSCIETILAHNKLISQCMYEPVRGRYILSASYDCFIKLWTTEDFSCSCVFHAHDARIMAADISTCGNMITSLSYDRTWNLWMNQKKFESDIPQSFFLYD